ncbi:histidine phosphatase family protein [Maricaulis sp.]|uniref:histidine phosphatase family protein n=1 Tax=Maricaulis sp. TaxID=1486257 RepID=UPI0025BC8310|nr:histidine phosphatase family protein [Maricaulis sp.]
MGRVLLARHGNTFGPGDTPVWVGAKEDLPLVESGEAQARALGEALAEKGLTPARLICGPLKRTRRAAEIVAELTGFAGPVEIDTRLTEIDYGSWGGKTNDEIVAEFGQDTLDCWDKRHTRPDGVDWSPPDDELKANALAALADAAKTDGLAVVITSNGILRYMHAALAGEDANAKVRTGHVCGARFDDGTGTRICWNEAPNASVIGRYFS